MTTPSELTDAVTSVRTRIAAAAARAGREPNCIRLIGVTKTVGSDATRRLFEAGVEDLGENRAVEGCAKVTEVAQALEHVPTWHFIGHLQRNKAARVWEHFDWIHAVDSSRLLEQLERCGEHSERRPRLLLQVNVSGEPQKQGLTPAQLPGVCEQVAALSHCDVAGLMCMAPFSEGPEGAEASRPVFRALRELRDDAVVRSGVELPELSMGMSQDFDIAVEEGATLVRVGTALTACLRGGAA